MTKRRFLPPWTVDEMNDACFIARNKNGQQLGYFYYEQEPGRRTAANLFTKDEARRLAVNFARRPELMLMAAPRRTPEVILAICLMAVECKYYSRVDQLEQIVGVCAPAILCERSHPE